MKENHFNQFLDSLINFDMLPCVFCAYMYTLEDIKPQLSLDQIFTFT